VTHILKVHGPPGTGKTTYLLNTLEQQLKEGVKPGSIGFVSFTRAAAREAKERAMKNFTWLQGDDLSWFRTIHSCCYRLLCLGKDQVLSNKHLEEFGEMYGYTFSVTQKEESKVDLEEHEVQEVMLATLADHLLFFEGWWYNTMQPSIEQAYHDFTDPLENPDGWCLAQVEQFHERYIAFKKEKGLLDFTDMLVRVARDKLAIPDLAVLFVDECQDNSPLQMAVVRMWAESCRLMYLGGDADQAIYVFQGARPALFLNWEVNEEVQLTQSWRVPAKVHALALQLIRRNRERIDVPYLPRDEEGKIMRSNIFSLPIDQIESEGTALLLARNRYLLKDYEDLLIDHGVPFIALRGHSPLTEKASTIVRTGFALGHGDRVTMSSMAKFMEAIPSKGNLDRGAKARFKDMAKISPDEDVSLQEIQDYLEVDFILRMRQNGAFMDMLKLTPQQKSFYGTVIRRRGVTALLSKPRVKIGTIHSVKGMEADTVVLRPEMARKTYKEWTSAPEGERRVWYVGITRAKHALTLLGSQDFRAIHWERI